MPLQAPDLYSAGIDAWDFATTRASETNSKVVSLPLHSCQLILSGAPEGYPKDSVFQCWKLNFDSNRHSG